MYSVDQMAKECAKKTGFSHCSADGLCFIFDDSGFNLLFVEFKPLRDDLNNDEKNSIKLELKLKALESVFCVLPHFIEDNVNESEKKQLNSFLMHCFKIFIFVTNYQQRKNPTKERLNLFNDPFEIKRLEPYPFKLVKSLSVEAFESFLEKSPISC
jgi:hypothetical protein